MSSEIWAPGATTTMKSDFFLCSIAERHFERSLSGWARKVFSCEPRRLRTSLEIRMARGFLGLGLCGVDDKCRWNGHKCGAYIPVHPPYIRRTSRGGTSPYNPREGCTGCTPSFGVTPFTPHRTIPFFLPLTDRSGATACRIPRYESCRLRIAAASRRRVVVCGTLWPHAPE